MRLTLPFPHGNTSAMILPNSPDNFLVVLVEDDDCIRMAFAEILESEGYEVLTFNNGREAIEGLMGFEEPCLILLDWMMPEMNGAQFLEARSTSAAGSSPSSRGSGSCTSIPPA